MALPSSGVMKASMIQAELGESGSWSINAQSSRALAKVPNGTIKFSDFYGKSKEITEIVANFTIGRYSRGSGFRKRYVDGYNPPSHPDVVVSGGMTIISPSKNEVSIIDVMSPAWTESTTQLDGYLSIAILPYMGGRIKLTVQDIGEWSLNLTSGSEKGNIYQFDLPANSAPLSNYIGQTKRLTITKLYYNLVQLLREVI